MKNNSESIYYGSGFTVQEILFDGVHGGVGGIIKFIETRIAQLSRRAIESGYSEDDYKRLELGQDAMRDVLVLISMLLSADE